ncbi:arginase family protein [Nanoarchaeota archaeon]
MKVLKVPFSKGGMSTPSGCELAPDVIIEKSKELFLNEFGYRTEFDVSEVEVDQGNIEVTQKNVYDAVKKIAEDVISPRACVLGGDHSVTYGAFKGFVAKHNGAGLVVLDAHPDCETGVVSATHEDYLRGLVKDGVVDRNRIVVFGIRNWSGNEKEFLETNRIKHYNMKHIMLNGLSEMVDTVTEMVKEWGPTYLSVDIDVCDPAFAPGTGYCEPGGFTSRELIYVVQRLKLLKNIKMIDIVEVNPKKDRDGMTSKLAAKLLVEMS